MRLDIQPRTALATLLFSAAFGTLSDEAGAEQLRFADTAPGGIASTGNTLGLSKENEENGPGTRDSIGAFISMSSTSQDGSFPVGTTADWTQNGSEGVLDLVNGAQVLYAELVWAGSFDYGGTSVRNNLEDEVALSAGGDTVMVAPDGATAQTFSTRSSDNSFWANYYIRSADVTSFVQTHGAGAYAVAGVPATESTSTDELNSAGWTLVVAYRGEDQPIRNLSIFVGGSFVDEDSAEEYTYSGFCAPPYGPVEGKVVVSATEGDANRRGETLEIASSGSASFTALSGPNNPQNNFFGSQINGNDGLIDTRGSFGTMNHDAIAGTNVSGGRQGWDLTTIPLSAAEGHLQNGQKQAVLRTATTGDSFVPTLMALEIDVKAPDFGDSGTTANPQIVRDGDTISVSTTLDNSGEAPAAQMLFVLPVDPGLELTSITMDGAPVTIGGNPVTTADLNAGIPAGTLNVQDSTTVELEFAVIGAPDNGDNYVFQPVWEHEFVTCDGEPAIPEMHSPPAALVAYEGVVDDGEGGGPNTTPDPIPVDDGDDDDGSTGGPVYDDAIIEEDGGCGCTTPAGNGPNQLPAALLGLGLAGAVVARRRRR